jgi:lysophospholipase L1-like esterase
VAIIGDSITVLSEAAITHSLHQYHVFMDAVSGTRMADHLGTLEKLASDAQPWDWLIELGTNDALPEPATNPNWAADFDNEVTAVQAQRCVVFVTVNPRFAPIGPEIDAAIASAVASHPNFHSLDWGDTEFKKPGWLDSDGIHPSKSGAVELAKLEHKAIRSCQGQ